MTLVDVLWLLGLLMASLGLMATQLARQGQGRPIAAVRLWLAWSLLGGCTFSLLSILAD